MVSFIVLLILPSLLQTPPVRGRAPTVCRGDGGQSPALPPAHLRPPAVHSPPRGGRGEGAPPGPQTLHWRNSPLPNPHEDPLCFTWYGEENVTVFVTSILT